MVFNKNHFSKQVCGTRDPPPPPFMANAILNFHFDFLTPSLLNFPCMMNLGLDNNNLNKYLCFSLSTHFKDRYGSYRYTLLGLFTCFVDNCFCLWCGEGDQSEGTRSLHYMAGKSCDTTTLINLNYFQTCQEAQNGKLLQQNLTLLRSRSLT